MAGGGAEQPNQGGGETEGSPDAASGMTRRTYFYDDFEDTDPKVIGVTATTAEISCDAGTEGTVMPFSAGKMLKVQDASAVSDTVYYQFGRFKDGKIGIHVRWWKNSDVAAMEVILQHYDKVTLETYKVRFLESGMKWQYHNSAGSYADVVGGGEDIADNTWNEVLIVLDLANIKYGRLITNGVNVDLSAILAQTAADAATEGNSKITFGITSGANDKATYMDEFSLTINEV